MSKIKKTVITVHGVNSRGEWQRAVKKVLRPHFECISIKYADYTTIRGPVRAVIALWSLPALVAGTLAAPALLALGAPWAALAAAAFAALVLVGGLWVARSRRHRVMRKILRRIGRRTKPSHHPRPHLIAHSMGTWVSMRALNAFPNLSFDRIVLVGCVLPRRFGWQRLSTQRPDAFVAVRNELGEADPVVWLVGLVHPLAPEMGAAGRRGFIGDPSLIHDQLAPRGPCDVCPQSPQKASIHNIPLNEFRHSDHFLSDGHCDSLWLPFLWGYEPEEMHKFRELCAGVVMFEVDGDWLGAAEAEEELGQRSWTWTTRANVRQSLEAFVADCIRQQLIGAGKHHGSAEVQDATSEAIRLMCWAVSDARRERDEYPRWREFVVSGYHPRTAVGRAISQVVRDA